MIEIGVVDVVTYWSSNLLLVHCCCWMKRAGVHSSDFASYCYCYSCNEAASNDLECPPCPIEFDVVQFVVVDDDDDDVVVSVDDDDV